MSEMLYSFLGFLAHWVQLQSAELSFSLSLYDSISVGPGP